MRKRPLVVTLVGWALVLSPLYYYLACAYVNHLSPFDFFKVLGYYAATRGDSAMIGFVATLKYTHTAISPLVGLMVLRVRRAGWYALLGYIGLSTLINVLVVMAGRIPLAKMMPAQLPIPLILSIPGLAIAVLFVGREIRSPYFNPRLRWWETAERRRLNLSVKVGDREPIVSRLFDINARGCCLVTETPFTVAEKLDMEISWLGGPIKVAGEVVWVSADGPAREVGIRFFESSKEIAEELKKIRPRSPRYEAAIPVTVEGDSAEYLTADLSAGGCFIETDKPVGLNKNITISLKLNGESVKLDGVVSWVADGSNGLKAGMGVKFSSRSKQVEDEVERLRQKELQDNPGRAA